MVHFLLLLDLREFDIEAANLFFSNNYDIPALLPQAYQTGVQSGSPKQLTMFLNSTI